jgi:hypothetical protein
MVIMFLMVLLLFILLTVGVCFFLSLLTKHDTVDYDMSYLWMEQEYSKEDFDYYR